jgi:electron transfer flavoprotein beta subunit
MLHIIVCMKLVFDTEAPLSDFKVDKEQMKPLPPTGLPLVISPFDENALEAALRIKDRRECRITVISVGKILPKAILQKALALGADQVIAIEGPEFENMDPFNTARCLVQGIRMEGYFDLIFTGRQSADWNSGLVWAGIAEMMDIPAITLAKKVEIHNKKATVERVTADGIEIVEADLPSLITFSNELGELRHFSLPSFLKAKKMEIKKWSYSDVGFKPLNRIAMKNLYIPDLVKTDCIFVSGSNPAEKGRKLAIELVGQKRLLRDR